MGIISTPDGYCNWSFEEDYVHIFNLFVLPECRRQGKAREVLKLAISKIRDKGHTGSICIVADPCDDSIDKDRLASFYERIGLDVYEYYG
jgi:ribosomal protein S18 acetylase RimI-like enzyme